MAPDAAAVKVECSVQPLSFSPHPIKESLLVAGLVDGTVEVHDFGEQLAAYSTSKRASTCEEEEEKNDDDDDSDDTLVSSTLMHTGKSSKKEGSSETSSCRSVLFFDKGRMLFTGGQQGDLAWMDPTVVCTFSATEAATQVNRVMVSTNLAEFPSVDVLHEISLPGSNSPLLATGDDRGGVQVWDPRIMRSSSPDVSTPKKVRKPIGCVYAWPQQHEDYVSAMDHWQHTLLVSSADSCMSIYDIRMAGMKGKNSSSEKNDASVVTRTSDPQEDELLSVKVMKGGKKVVCGTGEGVLAVFSWGTWGDISDRFPGHAASIDALAKVNDDALLMGTSDGAIKAVSIHPDTTLGVLGTHDGLAVEQLELTRDQRFAISLTHDSFLRLWDMGVLEDRPVKSNRKPIVGSTNEVPASNIDDEDEWEDVDETSNCASDSDDSEDESVNRPKQKRPRKSNFKSENEVFFQDL